jgi:hypothetical protein
MRRILVAAVAALVSAGALLGPAGAASAAKVTVHDETSDVFAMKYDVDADAYYYPPMGSLPNTDVVRTTVKHTRTAVRFTAKYIDLVEGGDVSGPEFDIYLRLSTGLSANLDVWEDTPGNIDTFLWRPGTAHPKKPCDGVQGDVDYDKNIVTGSVPRSCLGNPAWVQVLGNAMSAPAVQPGTSWWEQFWYEDSASNAGYITHELLRSPDCFTQCEGWTKKIRHG